MEREHGSVLKGAIKASRAGGRRAGSGGGAGLMSFRDGMAELTDRMATCLGSSRSGRSRP